MLCDESELAYANFMQVIIAAMVQQTEPETACKDIACVSKLPKSTIDHEWLSRLLGRTGHSEYRPRELEQGLDGKDPQVRVDARIAVR